MKKSGQQYGSEVYETMHSKARETQKFDDVQSIGIKHVFNVVNVFYIDRIRRQEFAVPAFFKEHLKNVFFEEGRVVRFRCSVAGYPPPEVEWYKGPNRIVESVGEEDLGDCVGYKYYASNEKGNLLLIVTNILPEDFGPYTCKIRNIVGEARSTAALYSCPEPEDEKQQKDRSSDKNVIVKETITVVERKPLVDVVKTGKDPPSVAPAGDESLDSVTSETEESRTPPEGQLMTVMFAVPEDCKTRSVRVTTSKRRKETFDVGLSHIQMKRYEDERTSQEHWDVFREGANDDISTKYPEEKVERLFSPGAEKELKQRARWIECGETSDSEYRKYSSPCPIPQYLTESTEVPSLSQQCSTEDDVLNDTDKWVTSWGSKDEVEEGTSAEESKDRMSDECARFFSRSPLSTSRCDSEDRSEYADVFDDDSANLDKHAFRENKLDACSEGDTTLCDISPISDSFGFRKETSEFSTAREVYTAVEQEHAVHAMEETDRKHDDPTSPISPSGSEENAFAMEGLRPNCMDELDAAKKLDELIAKLIEFSQRNYVRVSSLKVGLCRKKINDEEAISKDAECQLEEATQKINKDLHSEKYNVQKIDIPLHPSDQPVDSEEEAEGHGPEFVIPLRDMEVDAEENVVLNVSVTGFPAPRISWFKDSQPLNEVETGMIYDDLKRHTATYTCVAENESGEASTSATVTVRPAARCGEEKDTENGLEAQSSVKLRQKANGREPAEKRRSQIISASLVDYLRSKAKSLQQSRLVSEVKPEREDNGAVATERTDTCPRAAKFVEGPVREDVTLRRGSMLSLISMSTTSFESADENLTSSDAVWEEVVSTCEEDFMSTDEFIFPGMQREEKSDIRLDIPGRHSDTTDSEKEAFTPRPATPTPLGVKPPFEYDVTTYRSNHPFTRQPTDPNLYEVGDINIIHDETVARPEDIVKQRDDLRPQHPIFLVPLKDEIFYLGRTYALTCHVMGNPAPRVAWYRNGIRILPPGPNGRTSPRCFLTSFPAADSSAGTPPQRFKITSETRHEDSKNGHPVRYESHTLTISDCRFTDGAEYSVTAVNLFGSAITKAVVAVTEQGETKVVETEFSPPHFVKTICDSDGMLGGEAIMTFQLTGEPEPDITIFHNKEEADWQKFALTKGEHGQYELTIKDLCIKDEGEVQVYAVNVIGYTECVAELFVDERTVTPTPEKFGVLQWSEHADDVDFGMLDIREQLASQVIAPYFDDIADDVKCAKGAEASFVVRVYAWPAPEVAWFKKDEQILHQGRFSVESTDFGTHELKIQSVTENDAGIYTCVVKNNAGEVTCKAELSVSVEKSPPISSDEEESKPAQKRRFRDEYVLSHDIRSGSFSVVRLVRDKSEKSEFAAKYIRCAKAEWRERFLNEVKILKSLSHCNIIGYKDLFETRKHIILVMECAGSEWFEFLVDKSDLHEGDIALQIRQLCEALHYLHGKDVVHLDLKPENIMVAADGHTMKIIDFGSAVELKEGEATYWDYGNPEFVSPEVVEPLPVTSPADMWSLGVIAFTVLSGISPFLGESDYATILRVRSGAVEFDTKWFAPVSDEAKDFIRDILVLKPADRMSALQAKSHKWIENADSSNVTNALPEGRLKYFLSRRRWQRSLVGPKTSLSLRSISSLLKQEYDSASVAVSRGLISDYISSSTVTESEDEVSDVIVESAPTSPAFRHNKRWMEGSPYSPRKAKTSISIEDANEEQTVNAPAVTITVSKSSPPLRRKSSESKFGGIKDLEHRETSSEDVAEVKEIRLQPPKKTPQSPLNTARQRLKMIGKKVSFEDESLNVSDLEKIESPIFVTSAEKTELTPPAIVTEEVELKEIPPVAQMPEIPKPAAASGPPGVSLDRPQSVAKLLKEDRREQKLRRINGSESNSRRREKIRKKLSLKSLRRHRSVDLISSSSDDDSKANQENRESLKKDAPPPGKSKLSFFTRRKRVVSKGGSLDSSVHPPNTLEKEVEKAATLPTSEKPLIKGILKRGGSSDASSQSDPHIQNSLQKSPSLSPKIAANQESPTGPKHYRRRPLVKGVSLDLDIVAEKSVNSHSKADKNRTKLSATERRRAQMRRGSSAESALAAQAQPRVSGLRGPLLEKGGADDEPTAGMSLRRSVPVIKGNHSRSYSGPLNLQSPNFEEGKFTPLSLSPRISSPPRKYSPLSKSFFSRSMDITSFRPPHTVFPEDTLKNRRFLSSQLPTSGLSLVRSRSQDRTAGRKARSPDKRVTGESYAPYLKGPLVDQGLTQNQAYATLSCLIDASPFPEVTWYKDGEEILPSDRVEILSEPSINRYQLKIRNLSIPRDYGEYSCEARNSVDGVKTFCKLEPAVVPAKPSAPEFSGTDGKNIWVSWNPPTNCPASPMSYMLQCREMAAMKWVVVADSIKDTLHRLENLRPTTSYRFRVCAINNAGVGPFSKVSQRIQLDPNAKIQSLQYAF